MFTKVREKFKSTFSGPCEFGYNGFSILLPQDHMLPTFYQHHPKYDKFLPHLAKRIDHTGIIIDVGANVGDTLAGMVELNDEPTYICIEADDGLFEHLKHNVIRIKTVKPALKVHTIKALVGKAIGGGVLEGGGGTKHVTSRNEGKNVKSKQLDDILSELAPLQSVRILKTDVDGFDYDVIDSSFSLIREHKPIIFFECQYEQVCQKAGYENTLRSLEFEGYEDWTVFDNFGEVVLRTGDLKAIYQLMNYVWNQNAGRSTRTIYYYDMLAIQRKDIRLVDGVLAEYF